MYKRQEEGCYYLLFDSRSPLGANDAVRRWLSYLFQPANLLYHAGEHYQGNWFPAYGLLPRWHHASNHACEKPAGLETVTLTYYRDHVEHRVIGGIMRDLLAAHQVKLEIQELEYDAWHRGEVVSDIWLNSVNFTLPIEFSLFAYLYEVPLIQRCIPIDWQADACRWRAGEFNPATWSQRLLAGQHIVPLIHHWLMIQGQRSMRGVRMNTLGWFDFKSAWFAPPEP